MALSQNSKWRSLRFWLPALLTLLAISGGLVLYGIEIRMHEAELETEFDRLQTQQTIRTKSDLERVAQLDPREIEQSILAEREEIQEVKAALILDVTNTIVAATHPATIGRHLEIRDLGLGAVNREELLSTLQTVRQTRKGSSFFTRDRNGLITCFPISLPLQPGELEPPHGEVILMSYDLRIEKEADHRLLKKEFLVYFGGSLILALVMGVSLHFLITRRVEQLSSAIRDFAAGKPVVIQHSRLGDELSLLMDQFDTMATAIGKEINERKHAEKSLWESSQMLGLVLDHIPGFVFWKNRQCVYLGCNQQFAAKAGLKSPEEIVGLTDLDRPVKHAEAALYRADDRQVMETGIPKLKYEEVQHTEDGRVTWVQTSKIPLRDSAGEIIGVLGILEDITERKKGELALKETSRALHTLAATNQALLYSKNETELLSSICRIIVETGGYHMAWVGFAESAPEMTLRPVAHYGHEEGFLQAKKFSWADAELGRGPAGMAIRTGAVQVNSHFLTNPAMAPWREAALQRGYQSTIALPLKTSSETLGVLTIDAREPDAFTEDAQEFLKELADNLAYGIDSLRLRTERELLNVELEYQATHDHLTGAANRGVIIKALEQAIQSSDATRPNTALIYLDIDGFKEINDSFGHHVGDLFLAEFARRMREICRNDDFFGRLGGDEFVLLVGNLKIPKDLHHLLERILKALEHPLMHGDLEIKITASIGCVLITEKQLSATELIRYAEEAMYLVKSGQRKGFCIADKQIIQTFQERRNLDDKVREYVKENRLFLFYQPIVESESGKLFGAEALLRLQEKDGSIVTAAEFIPALQRTRFLPIVDEWVLTEVIRTFQKIANPLLGLPGFRFSVNVSTSIFSTEGYATQCLERLALAGISPGSLMLEIVESGLISANATLLENLQTLRAKGVKIALDDFGTGFSNLQQITTLPIDIIKIDRMFLAASLTKDSVQKTLLTTIVGMGKNLGYPLIAEGVENHAQAEEVKNLGCNYVQGYFYGPPMPVEELLKFAKKQAGGFLPFSDSRTQSPQGETP